MLKRVAVAATLFLAFLTPATAATADIARNTITGFIVSGYERFAGEVRTAEAAMDALCTAPSPEKLGTAQSRFRSSVIAWSRIETVRFGPILKDNRLERILFWPDRKSTGLKQVQSAIATKDETVTDLVALQQKSVALQNLGALEYVLFGTGNEDLTGPDGAFRCAYGRTIAGALAETGEATAEDWLDPQGIAGHMINPGPQWDDYRSEDEVMQELVGIWVHGAELIRDTRIAPFFGQTEADTNYKLALFWRSDMTIASMRANVAGLHDLFIVSGVSDALDEDSRWTGGSFLFEMDNFDRTASEITLPIDKAVADTDARTKINYLRILTRSLQKIATGQIAAELGLSVGFSALDGD